MTTPATLYGRDLSAYDEVDVDELLAKLSQEELTMLAKEVDPDVSTFPTTHSHRDTLSVSYLIQHYLVFSKISHETDII